MSIWPVHPKPEKGESLESWLIRQAQANYVSPNLFTNAYLNRTFYNCDFDLVQLPANIYNAMERMLGPETKIQDMTISPNSVMGSKRSEVIFWVVPRHEGRRYCPECLANDDTPYFRLSWRLTLMPICIDHRVFLATGCGNKNCLMPISPFRNSECGIERCFSCGYLLSETTTRQIEITDTSYTAVCNFAKIIQQERSRINCYEYDIRSLMLALQFLIKFLILMKHVYSEVPHDGFRNVELAYQLLGEAWILLQKGPLAVTEFLDENYPMFDHLNRFDNDAPFVRHMAHTVGYRLHDNKLVLLLIGAIYRRSRKCFAKLYYELIDGMATEFSKHKTFGSKYVISVPMNGSQINSELLTLDDMIQRKFVSALGTRIQHLSIIEEKNCLKIKPKTWLQRELWKEVTNILRVYGFVWVNDGRESLWLKMMSSF